MRNIFLFFFCSLMISCTEDILPKPKAYLSLFYEKAVYKNLHINKPYHFKISKRATVKEQPNNWMKIQYPVLKASIDITYRKVNNNLNELLTEADKLVFKHTLKAEEISSKNFINEELRVFGTLYEITGNAASQIQFHITDSIDNFIKGALYFYAAPNYDSVLPAVSYLKKDILKLIETLRWEKNELMLSKP